MTRPQVVVSGATGFVGQHLIPLLLQSNHDVVVIGRDENKARMFGLQNLMPCVREVTTGRRRQVEQQLAAFARHDSYFCPK